jgi:hypothetical protein
MIEHTKYAGPWITDYTFTTKIKRFLIPQKHLYDLTREIHERLLEFIKRQHFVDIRNQNIYTEFLRAQVRPGFIRGSFTDPCDERRVIIDEDKNRRIKINMDRESFRRRLKRYGLVVIRAQMPHLENNVLTNPDNKAPTPWWIDAGNGNRLAPYTNTFVEIRTDPRSDNAELLIPPNNTVFFDPNIVDTTAKKYAIKPGKKSLIDLVLSAGVPEEAIFKDRDLWLTLQSIEQNPCLSKNQTFFVKDGLGIEWLLKLTRQRDRAFLECAASYYLSSSLDFILASEFKEPLESNGFYLMIQKSLRPQLEARQGLGYWLACLAAFHQKAELILIDKEITAPTVSFRSPEQEKERLLLLKKKIELPFDRARLQGAIDYLSEAGNKDLIFNDIKKEHLIGKYVVDLELIGKGHRAIDLASLLIQFNVPRELWDSQLEKYLRFQGLKESYNEELSELRRGVSEAAYVCIVREVIASTLRFEGKKNLKEHQLLLSYLPSLTAKSH